MNEHFPITVKELIEELSKLPKDAIAVYQDEDYIYNVGGYGDDRLTRLRWIERPDIGYDWSHYKEDENGDILGVIIS